jgi:DNA replication protein DnaC
MNGRENEKWCAEFESLRQIQGTGFLYALIGPRGTGKTQFGVDLILDRINLEVTKHEAGDECWQPMKQPARYFEVLDFFIEIKSTYRRDAQRSEKQVVEAFAEVPLLVFDEIGVRGESKWEDDLFFSMMNKRYANRKDTLLIGNVSAADLPSAVGPSVASRMQETGGIILADWKSFRSKP